eukprot:773712-Prymnesium_polylepis.1
MYLVPEAPQQSRVALGYPRMRFWCMKGFRHLKAGRSRERDSRGYGHLLPEAPQSRVALEYLLSVCHTVSASMRLRF